MRYAISIVLAVWVALVLAPTVEAFAQSAQTPRVAARPSVVRVAPPPQRCLRALDGSCTKLAAIEGVRQRAIVFTTMRVSYFGTPAGTVPGGIDIQRFFRDDPVLYGLPTHVYGPGGCCILRTR
jgi:hypothetical protein